MKIDGKPPRFASNPTGAVASVSVHVISRFRIKLDAAAADIAAKAIAAEADILAIVDQKI